MGILDFICKKNRRKLSSAEEAKKRLSVLLEYERMKLPTNFPELLKKDLVTLFRKYPQFDTQRIEVKIQRNRQQGVELEQLWISMEIQSCSNSTPCCLFLCIFTSIRWVSNWGYFLNRVTKSFFNNSGKLVGSFILSYSNSTERRFLASSALDNFLLFFLHIKSKIPIVQPSKVSVSK